jgi:hypothetical protein
MGPVKKRYSLSNLQNRAFRHDPQQPRRRDRAESSDKSGQGGGGRPEVLHRRPQLIQIIK